MGKLERLTIALPEEIAAKVRAAVEAGEYATEGEVVREALRAWEDKREADRQALERLRALIAEGEAGPFHPAEEVFAELRAHVAEMAGQSSEAAE